MNCVWNLWISLETCPHPKKKDPGMESIGVAGGGERSRGQAYSQAIQATDSTASMATLCFCLLVTKDLIESEVFRVFFFPYTSHVKK